MNIPRNIQYWYYVLQNKKIIYNFLHLNIEVFQGVFQSGLEHNWERNVINHFFSFFVDRLSYSAYFCDKKNEDNHKICVIKILSIFFKFLITTLFHLCEIEIKFFMNMNCCHFRLWQFQDDTMIRLLSVYGWVSKSHFYLNLYWEFYTQINIPSS
jgi:hypothetical protein